MTTDGITSRIAEFVAETPFDALPVEAVSIARRMLIDVVGVSLAGAASEQFDPVDSLAQSLSARGSVPAPRGRRLDAATAALLTGAAAHLLDYDDVQTAMGGHPSVTLLPVVSSLGYLRGNSGADVLRAIVLATEIDTRLGQAMNPGHYVIGWHPTSVIGTIGATVAASCLLGLDAAATGAAIGIATSYAGGTKANFGTTVKSLHAGLTGRAGIEAALLAEAGASANDHILDRQYGGFFELFAPEADAEVICREIGSSFQVVEAGVGFKLLPCCGSTHSAAWAAIALNEANHVPADRIREIRIHLDPRRVAHTDRVVVETGLHAKFSAQYCAAVGAMHGQLTLRDFDDDTVREPVRQELLRKVKMIPSTDLDRWGRVDMSSTGSRSTYVEIEDVDGHVTGHFQSGPRGYPVLPPTDEEIKAKFVDCVAVAGPRRIAGDEIFAVLNEIEKIEDVRSTLTDIWDAPKEGWT